MSLAGALPAANLFWVAHATLVIAIFAIRWLYSTSAQGSTGGPLTHGASSCGAQPAGASGRHGAEHRLVAAILCWPVIFVYGLWLLRAVPQNQITPAVLTMMGWAIIGYVVHAAVELHYFDSQMSMSMTMCGGARA